MKKPKVLMVTGVYLPEANGAVLQCSNLIQWASTEVEFQVLAGANGPPVQSTALTKSGIPVTRIGAEATCGIHKYLYLFKFLLAFIFRAITVDIVHIHGFSTRNALVILLARLLRKRIILKMTSVGIDDPMTVKRKTIIKWIIYKLAHQYIAISPAFMRSSVLAKIGLERCHFIPNAVDSEIFCPASRTERNRLRTQLGLSAEEKIVLFVGHLSNEKRLNILYEAWRDLIEENCFSRLIVIGKTRGFEIDTDLATLIFEDSRRRGIFKKITFIEKTDAINQYMKAADIYVHTSIREGMPNAVLEAMASSLPCIVTEIPGVTDFIINHGKTGFLIQRDDIAGLKKILRTLLTGKALGTKIGKNAREYVLGRHNWQSVSKEMKNIYRLILGKKSIL